MPSFSPEQMLAVLESHGVDFVLIGAFAAATQGWNEPTGDIDITPDRDLHNIQRLADALKEMEATPLTSDGEVDTWPVDDQQLRMRTTTFFTTRYGISTS